MLKRCIECDVFLPESDEDNNYKVELPCGCPLAICSTNCKKNYISKIRFLLRGNILDKSNNFICLKCMKHYNREMLIKLILLFTARLNEDLLKCEARKAFLDIFANNCMNCLKKLDNRNNKVICKNEMVSHLLDIQKFEHYLCDDCKKKKVSTCNLCECYHFRVAGNLIKNKNL